MTDKKILLLALLFLAGCASDPMEESGGKEAPAAAMRKIVNAPANAARGELLIYFDGDAVGDVEQTAVAAAITRTAVTRSGIAPVDDIFTQLGVTSLRRVFPCNPVAEERTRAAGLHKWYIVTFGEEVDLDAAARRLAAVSEVSFVQFNTKLQLASDNRACPYRGGSAATRAAAGGFNDPGYKDQWHYSNNGDRIFAETTRAGADINVEEAWKLAAGDPSLTVAIVDQGIKYSHPDLAANMWINKAEQSGTTGRDDDGNGYADDVYGYNFALGTSRLTWDVEAYDDKGKNVGDSGHGTHVAGTVAAVSNNGVGVSGIAGGTGRNDGVKLMSCQIFSGGEGGSAAVSAEAIKYAADNGASILQCSWGYPAGAVTTDNAYASGARIEKQAIDYFIATKNNAVLDGGLVIFAAGNDAKAMSGYPGAYRDYISVTAFSPDYLPAYYTNYGPGCNVAAPGGRLYLAFGKQRRAGAFDASVRALPVGLRLYAGYLDGLPARIGRRRAGALLCAGQREAIYGGRIQIDASDFGERHRHLPRRHQTIPDHHAAAQLPQADGYVSDRRLPTAHADRGHTLSESESRRTAAAFARQVLRQGFGEPDLSRRRDLAG